MVSAALSGHVPTMHCNIDGDGGKGRAWVICSCGDEGLHRASLRAAWDDFYDHIGAETPPPSRRKTQGPLQSEQLFDA